MTKKLAAIELRQKNMSYSQIAQQLQIPKSTLSGWLKDYPLPKHIIVAIRDKNPERIKKYQSTMRKKREAIMSALRKEELKKILPISNKELYIAGLFLYWGEGGKTSPWRITLSNSDPKMIIFFINWARKCLNVRTSDFRLLVHLYSNMDVKKELIYWSKITQIPENQFFKPYIKESNSTTITHHSNNNHGTCNATINNANIARRVLSALEVIKSIY